MNLLTPASKRFRAIAAAVAMGPMLLAVTDDRHPQNLPVICVADHDGLLVATPCQRTSLWFASGDLRMAAGEPICWWTADNALFTNIPGVGPSLAERISNYRNSGGEFSLVGLQSIRGVGPSVADQALDEVTTACAHVFAH